MPGADTFRRSAKPTRATNSTTSAMAATWMAAGCSAGKLGWKASQSMPTAIARMNTTTSALARRPENGNTRQGVAASRSPPAVTQLSVMPELTAPDIAKYAQVAPSKTRHKPKMKESILARVRRFILGHLTLELSGGAAVRLERTVRWLTHKRRKRLTLKLPGVQPPY